MPIERASPLRDLDRVLERLEPLLRWRHVVVTVAAFAFAMHYLRGNQPEWSYFDDGSRLILNQDALAAFKPGGLHLYANYPYYQIGPLSLLLAVPFRWMGYDTGRHVAEFMMTAVAPLLVFVLERTADRLWPTRSDVEDARRRFTVLLGGVLVVQSWTSLAVVYVHLDDVLVLSAAVFAIWALAHERWLLMGLLIGVAIAAKPWGIILVPLLLVPPHKKRLRASLVAAAVGAAAWGPFFLADTRTFDAGRVQNGVRAASVLHLFGVALGTCPAWVRPVQIGLAIAAGCWAVARGRWAAVLLLGVALRIVLDTQILLYYDAGLVLAAFAWDLLRSRRPLPIWTAITFVLLDVTHGITVNDRLQALFHLIAALAPVAVILVWAAPRAAEERPTALSPGALDGGGESTMRKRSSNPNVELNHATAARTSG